MGKRVVSFDEIGSRKDAKDYLLSEAVIDHTRELFLDRDLTVRQVIEKMHLSRWYEGNGAYFANAFRYHFPKKGKGRGGARRNAGRLRGSKTCPGCGELRTSCVCPPRAERSSVSIVGVVTVPSKEKDGTYLATVAVEHPADGIKTYRRRIDRYPTHADIQRTIHGGEEVAPAEAKTVLTAFNLNEGTLKSQQINQ